MRQRVLVVIPAYNAEKYIAKAVSSVQSQTVDSWRCVISNDGSTDTTAQIAQTLASQDSRIQVLNCENGGVSRARNRGAALAADEEFLLFLDADDLLEPDAIAVLSDALERSTKASVAHGYPGEVDAHDRFIDREGFSEGFRRRTVFRGHTIVRSAPTEDTCFEMAVANCPMVSPGCAIIRRTTFDAVGGFDPQYAISADWAIWGRLTSRFTVVTVDRMTLRYRRSPGNMSSNHSRAAREIQRLRNDFMTSAWYTDEQHKLAHSAYRAFYLQLGIGRIKAVGQEAVRMHLKSAAQTAMLGASNLALAAWGRPPGLFLRRAAK